MRFCARNRVKVRKSKARFTIWRISPSRCAALLLAVPCPAAKIEMESILAVRQHGTARPANGTYCEPIAYNILFLQRECYSDSQHCWTTATVVMYLTIPVANGWTSLRRSEIVRATAEGEERGRDQ